MRSRSSGIIPSSAVLIGVMVIVFLTARESFSTTVYVHWHNNFAGKNLSLQWYSSPPWGKWIQFQAAELWPPPEFAFLETWDGTHLPNTQWTDIFGPMSCDAEDDTGYTRNIRWKLDVLPRHDPVVGSLEGYYYFRFDQLKLMWPYNDGSCGIYIWEGDPLSIGGNDHYVITQHFAPAINHLGGDYSLVRETMFIFDWTLYPYSEFEQVYRRESDKTLWRYQPRYPFLDLKPIVEPPYQSLYTDADIAEMATIAPIGFAVISGNLLLDIPGAIFYPTEVKLPNGFLYEMKSFNSAAMVNGVLTLADGTQIPGGTISPLQEHGPGPEPRTIARFVQQGDKLAGTGGAGTPRQGNSVAISADGSTALIGAPGDNNGGGAVSVFARNNGVWTHQSKLPGNAGVGAAERGFSAALSADGNTALIGGPGDSAGTGAAWIFTRSNGSWTQQGEKLVGSGADGATRQGSSVALSADGDTALIGGVGAAWVFTRSNDLWTQQGGKLVGSGGTSMQGGAVALSGDGRSALIGGGYGGCSGNPDVCNVTGEAWVFTNTGGNWTQQGDKLVGSGASGSSRQGKSVALSGDGNTAIIGGPGDSAGTGAAWVFIRSNGSWTQQGGKLLGTGANGPSLQGYSVALSADGNTAIWGGPNDNAALGAAWVFTRSGTCTRIPNECNNGTWAQQGNKLVGSGAAGATVAQGLAVAISGDAGTAIVGGPSDSGEAGAAWIFVNRALNLGNTPVGTNIVVEPTNMETGNAPVSLTFGSVSQAGSTTVTTTIQGPLPPTGFAPGDPPVYYNLKSTASFNGAVKVCVNYTGSRFVTPPRLFHLERKVWADATTSVDVALNIVCGSVTSLSPFGLFQAPDTTPPVIAPQITGRLGSNGWYTADVTLNWSVTDPESGIASSSGCGTSMLTADTPGITLTCSATNRAGLDKSASITIKIDKTGPVISGLPAPGTVLWPPDKKMVLVAVVSVSDVLSGPATFDVSGTSNEPADVRNPDILISGSELGPRTIELRADRLGSGSGRIYTLRAAATDLAGNTTTAQTTVVVPHDRGK